MESESYRREQSGAETLVSSCANCRLTMDESKEHWKWDHELASIVELLADNIDQPAAAGS